MERERLKLLSLERGNGSDNILFLSVRGGCGKECGQWCSNHYVRSVGGQSEFGCKVSYIWGKKVKTLVKDDGIKGKTSKPTVVVEKTVRKGVCGVCGRPVSFTNNCEEYRFYFVNGSMMLLCSTHRPLLVDENCYLTHKRIKEAGKGNVVLLNMGDCGVGENFNGIVDWQKFMVKFNSWCRERNKNVRIVKRYNPKRNVYVFIGVNTEDFSKRRDHE